MYECQNDISLKDVRTVEDLVGGQFVHAVPPDNGVNDEQETTPGVWTPACLEADTIIRRAISNVLRTQKGRYTDENRKEAYVEVIGKLCKYLRRRYRRQSSASRITNRKFLRSTNRAGWVYLFAKNTVLGWLRERIRSANGDERIRVRLQSGVVPAETFTDQQARKAAVNESLTFDPHQFAGNAGHGPDEMTLSDVPRDIEHGEQAEAELAALIRDEVATLPDQDQDFFWEYIDGRYTGRSAADRKRFQRLRHRIRLAVA